MEADYFQDKPWSFGDLKQIKSSHPNLKHKEVEKFLTQNEIYTRFKEHRKPSKYSPIYVYRKKESFFRLMFFDECLPHCTIGTAIKFRKVDAVRFAVSHLLPGFQECHFMDRFAIYDHAVHVKKHCVEAIHVFSRLFRLSGPTLHLSIV